MEAVIGERGRLESEFQGLIADVADAPRDVALLIRAGTTAYEIGRRPEAFLYLSRALELDLSKKSLLPKIRECARPEEMKRVEELARRPSSFALSLVDLLAYPFRGPGLGMMIIGAIFFYGVRVVMAVNFFPMIALFVGVVLYGYECMWFLDVFRHSSTWKEDLPQWPDLTCWTEFFIDWARVLSAQIVAFLPLIIMTVYLVSLGGLSVADDLGDSDVGSRWDPGFVVAIGIFYLVFGALGVLYLPMALMANAFFGSVWAAWNPAFVLKSAWQIRKEYLLCVGVFAVTWVAAFIVEAVVIATQFIVFAGLLVTFIEIFVMVVQMRVLGLLYRSTQGRLGWSD
jgi:hypothetical protein